MSSLTRVGPAGTTSVRRQLFESIKDRGYRSAFVQERVRSSVALQIRALREQRNKITQRQLGHALGMAQTWVSKLENPEYGKMSVATLLRLAEAFNTDLEIKFRPFSTTIDTLSTQGPEYFRVPGFEEEKSDIEAKLQREEAAAAAPQSGLHWPADAWDVRIQTPEGAAAAWPKHFPSLALKEVEQIYGRASKGAGTVGYPAFRQTNISADKSVDERAYATL